MKRKVMSKSNRIFYIVNTVLLMICLLLVAMPILNVVASSLSSPSAVIRGQVSFWPKGWNIDAYKEIFSNRSLLTGYKNSIIYTIVGTCVNIVLTIMAAYPLSVKDFIGRKVISALFIFVMIFTAPLIPTYLNVKNLGLLDSMWALILPGAISVYNMIIARTYFQNSIPGEMLESARLDGCDDICQPPCGNLPPAFPSGWSAVQDQRRTAPENHSCSASVNLSAPCACIAAKGSTMPGMTGAGASASNSTECNASCMF